MYAVKRLCVPLWDESESAESWDNLLPARLSTFVPAALKVPGLLTGVVNPIWA